MNYPFYYFRHWVDGQSENAQGFMWFQKEVNASERKEIEKKCPKPFRRNLEWGKFFLSFASDEFGYQEVVQEIYGENPDDFEWSHSTKEKFQSALDQWAKETHKISPLLFVIGPENEHTIDAWEGASLKGLNDLFVKIEKNLNDDFRHELKKNRTLKENFKLMMDAMEGIVECVEDEKMKETNKEQLKKILPSRKN